jgi:reductive dehalogenase
MEENKRRRFSRREFLRIAGLGLGSAAVVTSAATNKTSSQTKTMSKATFSDPAGRPNRPWWVKTVDEPTTEIDYDVVERFSEQAVTVRGPGLGIHGGADLPGQLAEEGAALKAERLKNGTPGWALKDQALYNAQMWDLRGESFYLGPQTVQTPEDMGIPKWSGSPEEAAKILRAAMRHFGAATVTFHELTDDTKKFIYSHDPDGKELIFTDEDEAYETEEARYIPNKCKYVIVFAVQMSLETLRRSPTHTACQTTLGCYGRSRRIQGLTQEFLRGLGYQALGEASINALGIAPAFAVLSGMGEMGRFNRVITPEYGPMVRIFKILTDLPVATDKPIDAGILEFCKSCKKCAEACPSGALSFEDEPTWEVAGGWNVPGHKAWFEDSVKCMTYWRTGSGNNCTICFAVCPFSKEDKAWIHDWVRFGISTVPVLDGFYRTMDDAFGYGVQADPEEWWGLDLPEYGFSTDASVLEG